METKISFRTILTPIVVITVFCCFAQQINAQEVTKSKPNKPDVKIKVNKQYDDKGNVTRYDSTYSYSWSGNGQVPTDVDSILRGFNKNFFFRSNPDSIFNGIGFGWPLEDDPFFNHPFSNDFSKQFEEFFGGNMFPSDSSSGNNPNDLLRKDYREILKQQQQRMEQFFQQFYQNQQPLIPAPDDTISPKQLPKDKVKPENQNYNRKKKTEKIITV